MRVRGQSLGATAFELGTTEATVRKDVAAERLRT
jgi:hypothetical protein